jgi:hypothetical protein
VVERNAVEPVVSLIAVPMAAPMAEPMAEPMAVPMAAPVDAVAALIAEPVLAPIVEPIAAPIVEPVPAETTAKPESKRPTITSIHATLVQHSVQLESTIEKMLTENVVKMEERLSAHTTEVINLLNENNKTVAAILVTEKNQTIYPLELQKDSEPEQEEEPVVEEEPSFFAYYQPFIVGFITGALASMFRTSIVLKRPFFL